MRHNNKINHLGRKSAHRKAMLANMASSLFQYKRLTTTLAKAKALRRYVEPLITKAKDDTTHSRRTVFAYLQDKVAVSELFREIAGKIADRPGGYTRILKTGSRFGDNAEMCIIELVDFNETMLAAQGEEQKGKKRRVRRGGAKKVETPVAEVKKEKAPAKPKKAVAAVKPEANVVEEVQPEPEVIEEISTEPETIAEDVQEEPKAEETSEEEKV
jgi:large subunit ribosomal protein L17